MIGACIPLSWSVVRTFTDKSMLPFKFSLRPGASVSFLTPSGIATSDSIDVTPEFRRRARRLTPVVNSPCAQDVAPKQIQQHVDFGVASYSKPAAY